jgi:PST family polysaccharide transporter
MIMKKSKSRAEIVRSSFALNPDDLGRRVVSGASFMLIGIVLRTLITFGSMPILARLLTPVDFGYVAMASVVTELAGLLGNFGFINIIIQRRTISRLQLDTVFWASVTVGFILSVAVFLASFTTDWIFQNEKTGELLRWLCLSFLMTSVNAPHYAILARLMRFRTTFWIEISTIMVRAFAAIIFAYLGFGSWSLVGGGLAGGLIGLLLIQIVVPYRPRFRFHLNYLRDTWKTSGSYFSSGLLYYVNMNLDLLLIGRQLGAGTLGYYQNARSLTDEIRGRIAMPLQRVLFPAFASIQNDHQRMQQSVIKSSRLLAAVVCPIGFGLSAIAVDLVPVLYGEQWLDMIPILSLLGVSATLKGSTATASSLFNAKNRVGLALRYNAIGTALMAMIVIITLPLGLKAVTLGLAIHSLYSVFTLRVSLGLIDLNMRHVAQILGFPIIASIIMWVGISWAREIFLFDLSSFMRLFLEIIIGAFIYGIALQLMSKEYFIDFLDIAKRLLKRS